MLREYLAEFAGSLFFVYVVLATGNALAMGAALALASYLTAPISGGHVVPTLTLVLGAAGRFPVQKVVPYTGAQLLGGLLASEIFRRYRP